MLRIKFRAVGIALHEKARQMVHFFKQTGINGHTSSLKYLHNLLCFGRTAFDRQQASDGRIVFVRLIDALAQQNGGLLTRREAAWPYRSEPPHHPRADSARRCEWP